MVSLASLTPEPTQPSSKCRKPSGYWNNRFNLNAEMRTFISTHENLAEALMPTASQLRAAGRSDLVQAVRKHGGFSEVASMLGLTCRQRPRKEITEETHGQALQTIRESIQKLNDAGILPVGQMPSATLLRKHDHASLVRYISSAGGFHYVAVALSLTPARKPSASASPPVARLKNLPNKQVITLLKSELELPDRRPKHYWKSWRVLETELRQFARTWCNGFMPLQRELIEQGRYDLQNAIRQHGGLSSVSRRAGLQPSPAVPTKRPRGFWRDANVIRAELLTYTARNGHPGLMPRRDQLIRSGRTDLVYAILRHGGFAKVAGELHLVWHGPSAFWRVFSNVSKRLAVFIDRHGRPGVMPSVQSLFKKGRMDLVYGVVLHGGVMEMAKRAGLRVEYPKRSEKYWHSAINVQRELEAILRTQPLEMRRYMPTSVILVQLGRADLATAIRDHGGWTYYAQRLGLRFAFERRAQGFWQREDNVLKEVRNYAEDRYGDWEHPGKVLTEWETSYAKGQKLQYLPSCEMLKRDGRSDIAFAIHAYHGGMQKFAERNRHMVADDTVEYKPAEELMEWPKYVSVLERWISVHGSQGTMPTKQDMIQTGRHDLRFATYRHGGFERVSRRLQLVFVQSRIDEWLPKWLALQAFKLGQVIHLRNKERLSRGEMVLLRNLEGVLNGNGVGKIRSMMAGNVKIVPGRMTFRRTLVKERGVDSRRRKALTLSPQELAKLRQKYRHLPPDDIISI